MPAFTLDSVDAPPGLREDLPEPKAGPGQLLVRVQPAAPASPPATGWSRGRQRHPNGVDALLDLTSQSPDQLNAYAAVVREGGRIASSVGAAGEGPGRFNVPAVATAEQLGRLTGLLAVSLP